MTETKETLPPDNLGHDILVGASAIAEFIYGDPRRRRVVYYLAETRQLPVFRFGKRRLGGRKSTLRTWVQHQEDGATNTALVGGAQ